jgi:hypothetical protein
VTVSKFLIVSSLTSIKTGTIHHNLEASASDTFRLLKGAGIPR